MPLHRQIPALALAACVLALFLQGCGRSEDKPGEDAYVSVPEAALRDRVAAVYSKVGTVRNGDRVRILERSGNKRFVRIHSPEGPEGWIEQRYLVDQSVYDVFQKLARDNAASPVEATATARRIMNMHVQPARDSDKLYQVAEGAKVSLIRRASTPKEGGMRSIERAEKEKQEELADRDSQEVKDPAPDEPIPPRGDSAGSSKTAATASGAAKAMDGSRSATQTGGARNKPVKGSAKPSSGQPQLPPSPLEDWWLVRDPQGRVGWVLGRMLDVDVALEIAQYAEGERIVAAFVIDEVVDRQSGNKVKQYAVLMSEDHDGLPYDFDQLRVFTWNVARSRYETAYREHDLKGVLPFTITREDYGKEGVLPTFTVREKGDDGQITERKYKMDGVIVRRILAPGEAPPAAGHPARKGRRSGHPVGHRRRRG